MFACLVCAGVPPSVVGRRGCSFTLRGCSTRATPVLRPGQTSILAKDCFSTPREPATGRHVTLFPTCSVSYLGVWRSQSSAQGSGARCFATVFFLTHNPNRRATTRCCVPDGCAAPRLEAGQHSAGCRRRRADRRFRAELLLQSFQGAHGGDRHVQVPAPC